MKDGVGAYFLQNSVANEDALYALPYASFYANPDQFRLKLAGMDGFDIAHVHNQPDWLGYVLKQTRPDVPMIYDVHDMDSVRFGEPTEDEVRSFQAADAYIFPSESYLDLARRVHGAAMEGKAAIVVYSMCNDNVIVQDPLPRVNGVVYGGGVSAPLGDTPPTQDIWSDYRFVVQSLAKRGIPMTILTDTRKPGVASAYTDAGAIVTGPLQYIHFLYNLSRYDCVFVGCSI